MLLALALLVIVLGFSTLLVLVQAGKQDMLSMTPPFDDVDFNGERLPGKGYRAAGSTVVNSNFIRLTPDRQSKKGSLWSKAAIGASNLYANLKFRISGQGKNFFGDGIAIWFVQNSFYVEGNLHGFQEKYYGVGIIFDTFKNTETLAMHRDVTILVNDGEKTIEMMTTDIQGCNANFRYHNERADFKVTDGAMAHIEITGNRLSLKIDPKATGEWIECVDIPDIGLKMDWLKKSYIGVTAATGQLADNHDIISLNVFDSQKGLLDWEMNPKSPSGSERIESSKGAPSEVRISTLEKKMNDVMQIQAKTDHQIEHDLLEAKDRIENLLVKYKKQIEESSSGAGSDVALIESSVKKEVASSLDSRLSLFEKDMNTVVEKKFTDTDILTGRKLINRNDKAPIPRTKPKPRAAHKWSPKPGTKKPRKEGPCECSNWPLYVTVLANVAVLWLMSRKAEPLLPYSKYNRD